MVTYTGQNKSKRRYQVSLQETKINALYIMYDAFSLLSKTRILYILLSKSIFLT